MATRSFITGFGSIASPIPLTGYIPYKYKRICRTNTFSPAMTMLKPCQHNQCFTGQEQISNNPSMRDPVCQKLTKELEGKPKVRMLYQCLDIWWTAGFECGN